MQLCHDLKIEADPVAPPLPGSLRAIPILFYLSVAGCAFFAAYFMLQKNSVEKVRTSQERITAGEKTKIAQIQKQTKGLQANLKKADSMIEWIKGSHSLQPLAMIINRSVDPSIGIVELDLNRHRENPWQIQLKLKLNGGETDQLEETIGLLQSNQYRAFSPSRSRDAQSITYTTTLIKQDPNNS